MMMLLDAVSETLPNLPSLPIAPADPLGLPAPEWLLEFLLILTFILHVIPMNLVLGGGFVCAYAARKAHVLKAAGRGGEAKDYATLATKVSKMLPVATAAAITLGVAPLLFVQLLYGHMFFSASILMGWWWFGVVWLLLIGYVGYYRMADRFANDPKKAAGLAFFVSLVFALIAFIFVNNSTLSLRPELWRDMYSESRHGFHLNFLDPTLFPRYLHFLIGGSAIAGLIIAIAGKIREHYKPGSGGIMPELGLKLFTGATVLQFASGLWFLFALPEAQKAAFMGESLFDTIVLWASVATAVASIAVVQKRLLVGTLLILLTIVGMAIVRQRLRLMALPEGFTSGELNPQYTFMAIFFVMLVLGIGVVTWMVRMFWQASLKKPE